MAEAYGLTSTMPVNLIVMSYSLCSPPADLVSVYLYGRFRTSTILRVTAFVSLLGACTRSFALIHDNFWPIVLGTFLMGPIYSIMFNSQLIICNKWFSDSERAVALAILNVSPQIGQVISLIITSIVFADTDSQATADARHAQVIKRTDAMIWN